MYAFVEGSFEHCQWDLRKNMEKQFSLRAVTDYEATYINAPGCWCSFHKAAVTTRHVALQEHNPFDAGSYDVWALISVRFALRVLGIRSEFYKLEADEPTYAGMMLPSLERRGEVMPADHLDGPM